MCSVVIFLALLFVAAILYSSMHLNLPLPPLGLKLKNNPFLLSDRQTGLQKLVTEAYILIFICIL